MWKPRAHQRRDRTAYIPKVRDMQTPGVARSFIYTHRFIQQNSLYINKLVYISYLPESFTFHLSSTLPLHATLTLTQHLYNTGTHTRTHYSSSRDEPFAPLIKLLSTRLRLHYVHTQTYTHRHKKFCFPEKKSPSPSWVYVSAVCVLYTFAFFFPFVRDRVRRGV